MDYTNAQLKWNYDKNVGLVPNTILPFSNKKIWWICPKNHEVQIRMCDYTKGRRCPYCYGRYATLDNNLTVKFPYIAKEWNYEKNLLSPDKYTPKSNKKVWWKCSTDHEWETSINSRTGINHSGCPYCVNQKASSTNNLLVKFIEIAKEWHPTKNGNLKPENVVYGSEKIIWWQCSKNPEHEWQTRVYHRTTVCLGGNTGCPYCCNTYTKLEQFVEEKLGIKKFNKKALEKARYQPDFKLSENLYLNVDGLYWHSEEQRESNYHFKLREAFEAEGKRIIQFYEDEVSTKWNIVESILNNVLGKTSIKIYARKCIFKDIPPSEAHEFYTQNHLMGPYDKAKHYGLCIDNELVSCMSVRFIVEGMEISRFGSKIGTSITGGFSKLLTNIIIEYKPKRIISFCDLRYATGRSYETLGFKLENISQGWCWTNHSRGFQRFNRLQCRAGGGKTERENAAEKGWVKIYDAGQAKYVLEL